ncbi:hypothetical protein D3C86_1859030 [compost metagenome]
MPKIEQSGAMVPDQKRLSDLGKEISKLINNVYNDSFRVFVDGGAEPIRDTDGNYFVNVPYKYYSIQDNYQI